MKKLTDNKKSILKIIIQSLPIVLAAIVFVIYAATFLPFSTRQMENSVALVECESYYQICAGGKPVLWFKNLGDSCMPENMSIKAGQEVVTTKYSTCCWVNKYPLFPYCPGLLLTANKDSIAEKSIAAANKDMASIIERTVRKLSAEIKQLNRKIEETDYYMKVHNVNDDGYNIMADYAKAIRQQKEAAEALCAKLKSIAKSKRVEMRLVTKYTLLCNDETTDSIERTPCRIITTKKHRPCACCRQQTRQNPKTPRLYTCTNGSLRRQQQATASMLQQYQAAPNTDSHPKAKSRRCSQAAPRTGQNTICLSFLRPTARPCSAVTASLQA